MKRILVVLDSCRYDSCEKIDIPLGPPIPAYTDTNHTVSSFIDFLCTNKMPRPENDYKNPWYKKEFNYLENVNVPLYFLSDNAHLHPVNVHVKGLLKYFKEYIVFEPFFHSAEQIVKKANDIQLGKNYYIILWFGETHQPYHYGGNPNTKWKRFVKKVDRYNHGADIISSDEMRYMHERQSNAAKFVVDMVWHDFLSKHLDADIVITADHGESFGENHIYGHGCDIHEAQFKVPFWRK